MIALNATVSGGNDSVFRSPGLPGSDIRQQVNAMRAQIEENLIYDLGLHEGEDAEFYLKKGFRVVGIEALPELAQTSTERLQSYVDSGQLAILNVAIAEKDGPVKFFENVDQSVWGTTSAAWAERNMRMHFRSVERTVEGANFSHILARYGIPYYLKIDIEGADLLCLEALRDFDARPKYVSIESTKSSWESLLNEFALLEELGYIRFKVVRQDTVSTQDCPSPALEGRTVRHHFKPGASGLFGEEAPGTWLQSSQAIEVYRGIFRQYKRYGDASLAGRLRAIPFVRRFVPEPGWYDTHAKRA